MSAIALPNPRAEQQVKAYVAPQWKLVWRRFRKHKLALFSAIIVFAIYLVAIFAEFLSPLEPGTTNSKYLYAPPQTLGVDAQGAYVYGYASKVDPVALRRVFAVGPSQRVAVGFFVKGYPYKLFEFIPTDVHLFGSQNPGDPMYLLGADRLGRDLFSRLIAGTRTSMSIGLIGVALSLILGVILGGISGYYGGQIDNLIQRLIEFLRSVPDPYNRPVGCAFHPWCAKMIPGKCDQDRIPLIEMPDGRAVRCALYP